MLIIPAQLLCLMPTMTLERRSRKTQTNAVPDTGHSAEKNPGRIARSKPSLPNKL